MAIKNVRIDDMDATEGAETHRFSLDNERWEIDLVDPNYQELREALAPFIKHARKPGSSPKRVTKSPARTQGAGDKAIRDWAKANGKKIAERGRIPQDIQDAYDAARTKSELSHAS